MSEYPREITDKNFNELFEKAKRIRQRTWDLDFISIFATVAIFGAIFYVFMLYFRNLTEQVTTTIVVIFLFVGLSLFASTFLADRVRLLLRRLNFLFAHHPTSEECIFGECVIIANRLIHGKVYSRNWRGRFQSATWRVKLLCDEFSLFSKDHFNVKRKLYAPEFNLLGGGANQIERMLVFSESKVSDLLLNFALAFVRNDDSIAHRYLRTIILETEKFGKLENLSKRIENQLSSIRGIITLVGGTVALVGGIIAIISAFS